MIYWLEFSVDYIPKANVLIFSQCDTTPLKNISQRGLCGADWAGQGGGENV